MNEGDPVRLPLVKKAVADGLMVLGDEKGFVLVSNNTSIVEKKKVAGAFCGSKLDPER